MPLSPLKISAFIFTVLIVLFGFTFLSEQGAVLQENKADDGIVWGNLKLKYPSKQYFLQQKQDSTTVNIEKIKAVTENITPIEDENNVKFESEKNNNTALIDSVIKDTVAKKKVFLTAQANVDLSNIDTLKIQRIEYPKNDPKFVKKLRKRFKSKNCRIFHYGDSQIEGDRITGYVRNRLQGLYGGNGPGFIPIKQVYHQLSAAVKCSDHWKRYALFDRTQERFPHKKYGTFMSVSRFTPYQKPLSDSLINPLDSIPLTKASLHISKSLRSYQRFRTFTHIGLHYGEATEATSIKVYNQEVLIQQDTLKTDQQYHVFDIQLSESPQDLRIELEGKVSPDFYGLTLDSSRGIQIDNIAMRGASGTIFTKSDAKTYAQMAKVLKPEIVFMQYGGNTVPYLKDSTAVERYGRNITKQIRWIQKNTNQAQILFIGPTDMCTSVNGEMQTYALLPYLNEVLKKNCLENKVAYWSMFEAMGGKGAMKLWVDQKLAGKDYTHFTPKGTKIISELLFTSLYLDLKPENR